MAETKETKVSLKEKLAANKAVRVTLKATGAVALVGAGFAGGYLVAKKVTGKK